MVSFLLYLPCVSFLVFFCVPFSFKLGRSSFFIFFTCLLFITLYHTQTFFFLNMRYPSLSPTIPDSHLVVGHADTFEPLISLLLFPFFPLSISNFAVFLLMRILLPKMPRARLVIHLVLCTCFQRGPCFGIDGD